MNGRMAPKISKRRVTLKDVAQETGVSMMSVSNVVNGRYGSMTKETRERIEQAIVQMGYRPHMAAQGLRSGRRFSLALLVIDRSPTYLAEPWMSDIVAGLTNHLIGRDYGLYIQGADAERVSTSSLLRHVTTDGLCVLLSGPPEGRRIILERIIATHQPVVLFQEVLPEPAHDVCVFRQDDRGGARALAQLVLRHAPRRMAMLTTSWSWPSLEQRELGIRDAIAALGSTATLDLIPCEDGNFGATVAALAAYSERCGVPDAILAGSDPMGVAAIRYLQGRGLRVPDDVEVTGFGAFDASRYSDPVLTSVRSPAYALGDLGAAALLERLETGRFRQAEVVLPVELVLGGSTRPERAQAAGKQGSAKRSSGVPSQR